MTNKQLEVLRSMRRFGSRGTGGKGSHLQIKPLVRDGYIVMQIGSQGLPEYILTDRARQFLADMDGARKEIDREFRER